MIVTYTYLLIHRKLNVKLNLNDCRHRICFRCMVCVTNLHWLKYVDSLQPEHLLLPSPLFRPNLRIDYYFETKLSAFLRHSNCGNRTLQ